MKCFRFKISIVILVLLVTACYNKPVKRNVIEFSANYVQVYEAMDYVKYILGKIHYDTSCVHICSSYLINRSDKLYIHGKYITDINNSESDFKINGLSEEEALGFLKTVIFLNENNIHHATKSVTDDKARSHYLFEYKIFWDGDRYDKRYIYLLENKADKYIRTKHFNILDSLERMYLIKIANEY